MNESDGIEEPLEQVLQHGLAVAAQLGREVSRMWQQRMEEKAKLTEREARRLQMAFDSEKRTALAALKPTQEAKWWDQAKPAAVIEAYRVANAWKDHDPAAAAAEKNIREQAATRFGIDGQGLARLVNEAAPVAPVLTKEQQQANDLQAAKAYFDKQDPERLSRYETRLRNAEIEGFDSEAVHSSLVVDWIEATGKEDPRNTEQARQAEAQAVLDREQGDQQATVATGEYAAADKDKEAAVTAEFDGPNAAEEAWYRDTFLTDSPEAQEVEDKSTEATESAEAHEQAGAMATVHAGAAYNSAERQEALAARMRAAGAPEKGIEARQFAESQQKHPIGHAAAGKGKTVNKVKTTTPQKAQTQAKQRSR